MPARDAISPIVFKNALEDTWELLTSIKLSFALTNEFAMYCTIRNPIAKPNPVAKQLKLSSLIAAIVPIKMDRTDAI